MTTPDIRLFDLSGGQEVSCPLPADFPFGFAVALGNFDGVHAAHRKLIAAAVDMADRLRASGEAVEPAAFFFRTPSGDYMSGAACEHLTTLQEKLCLLRSCGLRYVLMADFPSLRDWDASDFMVEILQKACAVKAVACGYNFRFGKNGLGRPEHLQTLFAENCSVLPCQTLSEPNDTVVSSSAVRKLLQSGDSLPAAAMLRYPYVLSGEVVHGKQLGRTLGFPTANLPIPAEKLFPCCGVYASFTLVDGEVYCGVSNVGKRPTVDAPTVSVNCETYLLHFSGDLYGKEIRVFLLHYLRGETAFPDLDTLKSTIARDVSRAEKLLRSEQSKEFIANIQEYFKKD